MKKFLSAVALSLFFILPLSAIDESDASIGPFIECHTWIQEFMPDICENELAQYYEYSLGWAGPGPTIPYSPSTFTKISEKQITEARAWSAHPKWAAEDDIGAVQEYYKAHEEFHLDRFLCFLGTQIFGCFIHGNMNQEELSKHLSRFDIRHLLAEGPSYSSTLSEAAQQLIYESLHDIERVVDVHLHNVGYDEGNWVAPEAAAFRKAPYKNYFTFVAIRYAAGMSSVTGSTHEARKRLHLYTGHFPKLVGYVLPIHKAIHTDGTVDWKATGNFLPNKVSLLTAMTFSNPLGDSCLLPAVSIHPFDPQWKEKVHAAHAKGIRLIKWMPPQSIPPHSDLLDEYYDTLRELNITIIAHAGVEHVIAPTEANKEWSDFGNPLFFRKPLSKGVNVILAHCAHNDPIPDLDHPKKQKVPGYRLFLRLAKEAHQKNLSGEWKGLLFGDLAGLTHSDPKLLKDLLVASNEESVHLIYGSDYPYTNLLSLKNDPLKACAKAGILNPSLVAPLKEIRALNPLLANYVFVKNLEVKTGKGEKFRFPNATYTLDFEDVKLTLCDEAQWSQHLAKQ